MKKPFFISFTLHLLLMVILLLTSGSGTGRGSGDNPDAKGKGQHNDQVSMNVIPKEQPVKARNSTTKSDEDGIETKIVKSEPVKKKCTLTYGGIGIEIAMDYGTIQKVFKGYPAEKSGLLPGDYIEPVNSSSIKGEPGSPLILKVNRNGSIFSKMVIREEICYENSP